MYIFLDDIITCLETTSIAYLNPDTMNLLFEDEIERDLPSNMLKLPVIQQEEIMQSFVNHTICKLNKRVFNIESLSIDSFYNEVNKYQLADDWEQFRHEYCSHIAEEWCCSNNIPFTKKQNRGFNNKRWTNTNRICKKG